MIAMVMSTILASSPIGNADPNDGDGDKGLEGDSRKGQQSMHGDDGDTNDSIKIHSNCDDGDIDD